MRGILWYSQA